MSTLPRTRLYCDAPLVESTAVPLTEGQAHYLRSVLRLAPGAELLLFNGRDGEWLATLSQLGKSRAEVTVLSQRRVQPPDIAAPWLLFAPLKAGRTEWVVEKATELGVGRLLPVYTRRSDVTRINRDRLAATAIEAAEQCERLDVPPVDEGQPLLKRLESWDPARILFIAAERRSVPDAVTAVTARTGQDVAWLIGPEGGFDPLELDALLRMPFVVPVSLGPRILRADTAALAALTVWQAVSGDWS